MNYVGGRKKIGTRVLEGTNVRVERVYPFLCGAGKQLRGQTAELAASASVF